jgi:hypothetical protein
VRIERRGKDEWAVVWRSEVMWRGRTRRECEAFLAGFQACVELDP